MSPSMPDDVRAALAAGHKIEAIRLLRQQTGLGLAEAKAAVESAREQPANTPLAQGWELPPEAKAALEQGKLLQAIRALRASGGVGLKDAKRTIDAARFEPARHDVHRPSGLAPGEVPRGRVGGGLAIVVLLVVAAVLWILRN